jgi:hypothetical protein
MDSEPVFNLESMSIVVTAVSAFVFMTYYTDDVKV